MRKNKEIWGYVTFSFHFGEYKNLCETVSYNIKCETLLQFSHNHTIINKI